MATSVSALIIWVRCEEKYYVCRVVGTSVASATLVVPLFGLYSGANLKLNS